MERNKCSIQRFRPWIFVVRLFLSFICRIHLSSGFTIPSTSTLAAHAINITARPPPRITCPGLPLWPRRCFQHTPPRLSACLRSCCHRSPSSENSTPRLQRASFLSGAIPVLFTGNCVAFAFGGSGGLDLCKTGGMGREWAGLDRPIWGRFRLVPRAASIDRNAASGSTSPG